MPGCGGRRPVDSVALHAADTLRAGAGLCDAAAVEVLVSEGPARVRELAALGAVFDRNDQGVWELAREGGHSTARVVHAGGAATGAEVERTLVDAARATATRIWEHWFALDLIVEGGRCRGVTALDPNGQVVELRAAHTLLATGGAGQLYSVTTNPLQSTGDGVAMALRAGVPVADVEFVQFHPTALHGSTTGPRPLLSEALRGEGARLRDHRGQRFVDELQPRDVVAAAVAARMREDGVDHVWLDVGAVDDFDTRFPTLAAVGARTWASTRAATGCRWRRRPTTCAAASSPISTAPPPCRACGRPARWPAPGSTAPTGWPRTRCWRAWYSGPGPSRPCFRAKRGPARPAPSARSFTPDAPEPGAIGGALAGHPACARGWRGTRWTPSRDGSCCSGP